MATGPEHYRIAEKILAGIDQETDPAWHAAFAAEASAHATLALAAACGLNDASCGKEGPDRDEWRDIAGKRA